LKDAAMQATSNLILPIDPEYTGHREAEQRHRETREWLRRRERELDLHTDMPSIAPDKPDDSRR
jgi:hypothetical protein